MSGYLGPRPAWADPAPPDSVHDDVHRESLHDWLDERPRADDDAPTRREAEADLREDERRAPKVEPVRIGGWAMRTDLYPPDAA